jgi:hypothetical protein
VWIRHVGRRRRDHLGQRRHRARRTRQPAPCRSPQPELRGIGRVRWRAAGGPRWRGTAWRHDRRGSRQRCPGQHGCRTCQLPERHRRRGRHAAGRARSILQLRRCDRHRRPVPADPHHRQYRPDPCGAGEYLRGEGHFDGRPRSSRAWSP